MNLLLPIRITLLALLLIIAPIVRADVTQDWGTVATPLTSEVTFSFAQYDINLLSSVSPPKSLPN